MLSTPQGLAAYCAADVKMRIDIALAAVDRPEKVILNY